MENDAFNVAEFGFLMKMALVACAVIIAGIFIRKRPAHSGREADPLR